MSSCCCSPGPPGTVSGGSDISSCLISQRKHDLCKRGPEVPTVLCKWFFHVCLFMVVSLLHGTNGLCFPPWKSSVVLVVPVAISLASAHCQDQPRGRVSPGVPGADSLSLRGYIPCSYFYFPAYPFCFVITSIVLTL